jgi:hypothetical protein
MDVSHLYAAKIINAINIRFLIIPDRTDRVEAGSFFGRVALTVAGFWTGLLPKPYWKSASNILRTWGHLRHGFTRK